MQHKENIIHLISLSVQGLRDNRKRTRFIQWLNNQKTDIAFLQETHFTDNIEQLIVLQDAT